MDGRRIMLGLALALLGGCVDFGSYSLDPNWDGSVANTDDAGGMVTDGTMALADGGQAGGDGPCIPDSMTCAGHCGMLVDNCGKSVDCGGCPNGLTCGGGGPNMCGMGPCMPTTCLAQQKNCGLIDDTCGKTLDCGTCGKPQTCGGGGVVNVCGCAATTCLAQKAACGMIPDGCGLMLFCGNCQKGQTCSNANQCVANTCPSDNCDPTDINSCPDPKYCFLLPCTGTPNATRCLNDSGVKVNGDGCAASSECIFGSACPDDSAMCETVCSLQLQDCNAGACQAVPINGATSTKWGVCR